MSSIQDTSQLFHPLVPASKEVARLNGTLWAKSILARTFYRAIELAAVTLAHAGISADTITYLSLVFAVLAGVCVGFGHLGLAAGLVLLSGSLDLVDGALARTTGSASRWGALLDSTLDRVADAAPLVGVVVFYANWHWAALAPLVAIVAGFVISYVRARTEALGQKLPSLFMRRAERVLLIAGSLALGTISLDSVIDAPLMLAGVALSSVLNVVGAVTILAAARVALNANAG